MKLFLTIFVSSILSLGTTYGVLHYKGYVVIHESDIPLEPVETIVYKEATDEAIAKWWVNSTDMVDVRKRLCSNNYSKNK